MNASQSPTSERSAERLMPAERRLALLEVFREITRELFSRFNTLEIAEIFLERCSGALNADQVGVYLGRDEYEVELLVGVGQPQGGFSTADHSLAEAVMRSGQVLEEAPSINRPGGALAMPLTVSVVGTRRITGVITAEYFTQKPDPADLETLALFAPLLAAALELAHRHRREQIRLRDERLRAEVTAAVSRLRRIPELSHAVANVITQILGYQMVAIFSLESDQATHLKLEAWSGASTPRPEVPLHGTQTGEAVLKRQATILDLNDPRFLQTDIPINAMICVPMIGRDGVLGCLNVATGGKQFLDMTDLKRLQSIINPVAVAFENARLYETLEQRTQDLERLGLEAQHVAMHDHLTGLPNRRAFDAGIQSMLDRHQGFCLGVIDLVGFKKINDQLGHVSGDITLIRIADVLRGILGIPEVSLLIEQQHMAAKPDVSPNGSAYRVGGDEFHLLLPCDRQRATQMIQGLIAQVQALEVEGDHGSLPVGLNVGLAEYPSEASTLDQLQSLADDRMYAAKRAQIPMLELPAKTD
jgi:GGDEF domain-containing protein/putative methionine-R-sulfoxide reductase with GAF domain